MVKSYEKQGFTTECAINGGTTPLFWIHDHYPLIPVDNRSTNQSTRNVQSHLYYDSGPSKYPRAHPDSF